MKPDLLKLNNKFIDTGTISSTDLDVFADNNLSSIDSSTGNEVFMVARQSARWLLRGLKHEPLTEAQAKRVMRLKEVYAYHGSKTSFSKKPVIIDYGCNSSMFCRMFSEYLPDAEYILVDIDSPALKYAYQRCRLFAKNVRTIAITEDELTPVLPKSDLIFCRSVMEHLWYPDVALDNFCNSLIDKGLLITNFAGKTGDKALKSDTQRAYDLRDRNIVFTYNHFSLVYGKNYRFVKGSFKEDGQLKVWRKKQEANSYSVKC